MQTLLIDIDAAVLSECLKHIEYTPFFAKLLKDGMFGDLQTVPPPTTSIGTPAMFQGLNPGKSRSFCFSSELKDYRMHFFGKSEYLLGDTLWDILSREGYKSLVFNVPSTYPAKPLNGTLVSSFDSVGDDWVYPKALKSELTQKGFAPFERNVREFPNLDVYSKFWYERSNLISEIVIDLLKRDEYDFAFIGFLLIDRLQHHFMHKEGGDRILRWSYVYIDRAIQKIVEATKPENIIIASDHGMSPVSTAFDINTFLYEYGLLKLPAETRTVFDAYNTYLEIEEFDFDSLDVWSAGEGTLIINDERFGGHSKTSVKDLKDLLETERDPDAGCSPFSAIYEKEEIWNGPYLKMMPDLICLPNSEAGMFCHWIRLLSRRYMKFPYSDHCMDGMYATTLGKGRRNANILDITPTVLKSMDVKLPNNLDGRPLI